MSNTNKLQFTLVLDSALKRDWDTLNEEYDVLDNASRIRIAISQAAKLIRKSKFKKMPNPTLRKDEKSILKDFDYNTWFDGLEKSDKDKTEEKMLKLWNEELKNQL
jgi:hypothetical protein